MERNPEMGCNHARIPRVTHGAAGLLRRLLLRDFAGLPHGAEDPPAPCGDLGVGRSAKTLVELALAPAGERQVRVRIDEARQDGAATGVDRQRIVAQSDGVAQLALGADEDDTAVEGCEGRVGDDLQAPLLVPATCNVADRSGQLGDSKDG